MFGYIWHKFPQTYAKTHFLRVPPTALAPQHSWAVSTLRPLTPVWMQQDRRAQRSYSQSLDSPELPRREMKNGSRQLRHHPSSDTAAHPQLCFLHFLDSIFLPQHPSPHPSPPFQEQSERIPAPFPFLWSNCPDITGMSSGLSADQYLAKKKSPFSHCPVKRWSGQQGLPSEEAPDKWLDSQVEQLPGPKARPTVRCLCPLKYNYGNCSERLDDQDRDF